MQFEESILIRATQKQVYDRAADLERYCDLADEYRESEVLSRGHREAVVQRNARIAGIPVTWQSSVTFVPSRSIEFHQVRGPLRGMKTVWRMSRKSGETRLSITHELNPAPGPVGDWVATAVYSLFVKKLALKILNNLKASVEAANE